jgi:hypothetical protein
MSLETELAANTAALKENTAAFLAFVAASGTPAKVSKAALTVVEPEPPSDPEPQTEIALPTKIEKKPAKKTAVADTPSIPSRDNEPGGPVAGEHVDVDEVLAEITAIVRQKITESADPEKVKTAWTGVREKLGVERISDLKSEPAKLLQALAAAKKL